MLASVPLKYFLVTARVVYLRQQPSGGSGDPLGFQVISSLQISVPLEMHALGSGLYSIIQH